MKKIALLLCLLVGIAGISCVPLSYYLTPADISPNAVKYVEEAGVADANKYDGYPNLRKAELLKEDVKTAYKLNQFELEKAAEKNNLEYSILSETTNNNYIAAMEREDSLFGETGMLSTGLTAAGFGMFTGLLGLMRKRPGDITPEEASTAIAQATGESQAEIEAKMRQLKQVVTGVSEFKAAIEAKVGTDSNEYVKASDLLVEMKNIFNAHQDTDTQQAVAAAKVS